MTDSAIHTILLYAGNTLPGYFHREDWVAATLFVLFVFILVAYAISSHFINSSISGLFTSPKKTVLAHKLTIADSTARFLLLINAISVYSLYIYTVFSENSTNTLRVFIELAAVTFAFYTLKYLGMVLMGYVFASKEKTRLGITNYFRMFMLGGLVLYPLLVLRIYLSGSQFVLILDILAFSATLFLLGLISVKIFQIFYTKYLASFYILLYLCTLEFLPYIGIIQVYYLLIRDIKI
jgi:hypothetical protein